MEYMELAPAPALRATIRCYWFLTGPGGEASAEPALPDGSPELILCLADPFVALGDEGHERVQPRTMLVGQVTRPFHVRPSGRVDLVGVRLEAGGATWLVDDIGFLAERERDVADAHGGALEQLRAALTAIVDPTARAAALDAALAPLIAAGPHPDWRVVQAVASIRAAHGLADVAALAATLRTSPRTLQRLFAAQVGLTPKLLARIVRFQRVFAAWRAEPESLSRVAAACGYFDHAHLVRDFRELAGVAPARFLPNQPEFTRFFTS
jgi:methylphosphotriester-DNA--protein-cysteine methyltransferase